MSILAKCPECKTLQPVRNKKCRHCSKNLDQAKRSKQVQLSIIYYDQNGDQRKIAVSSIDGCDGTSLTDAKDAEAKLRASKREKKKLFDIAPGTSFTVEKNIDWYEKTDRVKQLKSKRRVSSALAHPKKALGEKLVNSLLPTDLEEYQIMRQAEKASPASIDMELRIFGTAVTKAFLNNKHDGTALRAFKAIKPLNKYGQNARSRIVAIEEYLQILEQAPQHLAPIIVTAMNTGMRQGEILNLRHSYIKDGFIRLPHDSTKESKTKTIPINKTVQTEIDKQPRAIHHDFVFTYRGDNIAESGIKRSFRTAVINAKVPYGRKTADGLTFHDLRRTVKTNMLRAGISKTYRDLILGHSLRGMDAFYIKPDDEDLMQAMNTYTKYLDKQIEVAKNNIARNIARQAQNQ